jgi:hypothetical protein
MGDSTTLDEMKQLTTSLSTNVTTLAADISHIKADQARLHVAVNKVQSEVVIDGSSSSGAKGKGVHCDGSVGGPTATHKLCFPTYESSTDPLAWLHRSDQFFRVVRTPEEEKTWYASYYLEGDTQQWYFRLERNQGIPTWERFVDLFSRRFGPPERSNPLGELIKLSRSGSVAEFQEPPTRTLEHRIHLLPDPPIVVRSYRYPQLLKDEIERKCDDMLQQGIIRTSTSSFSSPALLVRKKDKMWRFCADYRRQDNKGQVPRPRRRRAHRRATRCPLLHQDRSSQRVPPGVDAPRRHC